MAGAFLAKMAENPPRHVAAGVRSSSDCCISIAVFRLLSRLNEMRSDRHSHRDMTLPGRAMARPETPEAPAPYALGLLRGHASSPS